MPNPTMADAAEPETVESLKQSLEWRFERANQDLEIWRNEFLNRIENLEKNEILQAIVALSDQIKGLDTRLSRIEDTSDISVVE